MFPKQSKWFPKGRGQKGMTQKVTPPKWVEIMEYFVLEAALEIILFHPPISQKGDVNENSFS